MRDLSRAKSERQPDADGTTAEDDRQLTELLLQNRVSLNPPIAAPVSGSHTQSFWPRVQAGLILFVALPLSLFAYFSSRAPEDDFYA